ncbi:MAG: hypothetical protein ABFR75_04180 [Acidobacteriota bacterium]
MKLFSKFFLTFILVFISTTLFSHHAMEYIEMESYNTPFKGEFVFHLHFDYMVENKMNPNLDHWEFTPGISFGITDRLMFDAHTHFAKFGKDHLTCADTDIFGPMGPSPFMEAVAFSLQYRLTKGLPVNIAVAGLFETPFSRSRELLDGKNVLEGILIVNYEFAEHSNITLNIKHGIDGNEKFSEWALGVKTPLSSNPIGIAGGIEVFGDFNGDLSILAGIYFPLGSENIIFKTGLQFGGEGSRRANSTMMYRF